MFAEGRQAEEAKKAGAHIVGGPELIDGVGLLKNTFPLLLNALDRFSITGIEQLPFYVLPL